MAVSSTSVKGFAPRQSLYGVHGNPTVQEFIIENSSTLTIGDAVRLDTSGYVKRCAAGDPVLGIVTGLVSQNGINVFEPRVEQAAITGATLTPDDTLATSSTNTSDGTRLLKAQVIMDPAGAILYDNIADGALAQTNVGQFFDVGSNAGQISQASASDTSGQFQLLALDSNNTSRGLFRIAECQMTSNVNSYNSTAVIAA